MGSVLRSGKKSDRRVGGDTVRYARHDNRMQQLMYD